MASSQGARYRRLVPEQVDAPAALVHRFYDEMWNRFDVSVLETIASSDVTFRGSLGHTTAGREGLADYVRHVQVAFPDFSNEIVELVADDTRVFARLRYRGTHRGPLGDLSPTGRAVAYDGAALFHVDGGVIVDVWVLGDRAALAEQLATDTTLGR